jgi:hypothetical protein
MYLAKKKTGGEDGGRRQKQEDGKLEQKVGMNRGWRDGRWVGGKQGIDRLYRSRRSRRLDATSRISGRPENSLKNSSSQIVEPRIIVWLKKSRV